MLSKIKIIICSSLLLFLLEGGAFAQKNIDIVANVNDDIISNIDLQRRVDMTISQSGLKKTRKVERKIRPQTLQTLIDESLQRQEAAKFNINVAEYDLSDALKSISSRNKIKYSDFPKFIEAKGINYDSFKSQIKSQLIWNKIVMQKIRSRIIVTNREIDEEIEHISSSSGIAEIKISQIFLPFANAENKKDVKQTQELAEELYAEILEGADFSAVAKEFSKNSYAENGGDLGWNRKNKLSDEIVSVVTSLQVGEVSKPFFTKNGYSIIKLNERRAFVTPQQNSEITMRQAAFVTGTEATKSAVENRIKQINSELRKVKACNEFAAFAKRNKSAVSTDKITTNLSDVNDEIRPVLKNLKINNPSKVLVSSSALHVFMICDKKKGEPALVVRENVKEVITRKKLDLSIAYYMQNLRRTALIEIK